MEEGGAGRSRSVDRWQLVWQVAAGISAVAYSVSVLVVPRDASGYSSLWDGWFSNIAHILTLVALVTRLWRNPSRRLAWAAIAFGVACYEIANVLWLFYDQNLVPVPFPASSDAFYLLSYVGFLAGVLLMTHGADGDVAHSVRLDGLIAGFACSAVVALFWFGPVLEVSGQPFAVAVGMAYPLFDLMLLVVLLAGLAPQRYRLSWRSGLLMAGVCWFVVGDVVYLNQVVAGTYVGGTPLDATWVAAIFLIGLAALSNEDRGATARASERHLLAATSPVPLVFGMVLIGVLTVSLFGNHSGAVGGLGLAALVALVVRMALAFRELRVATSRNFDDARSDALTGLANRRGFFEAVTDALAASPAPGGPPATVGVLLVDLDQFKEVNDTLGHHVGDELLRIVAERFRHQIGDRGAIARIGGDEFSLALGVSSSDELVAVAGELVDCLSDPLTLDGLTVRMTASVGAAMSPQDGMTADDLLRRADVAMYEAKKSQGSISFYHADYDGHSRKSLALISELQTAIESRSLVMHYQPTLDLHTQEIRGVEALVRWQHPTRGLLYPDSFVPLAERVGLMPQLTRTVLELAIAQTALLERSGHPLHMSINISRSDLVNEQLPTVIDTLLAQHRVVHESITLEVTESSLGDDPVQVTHAIGELRARGIRIAIDDFGVGYSSMSQLLALPVDELKIDKCFVLALASDDRARAVLDSTVTLARALGLSVVAEGVETAELLTAINDIGVDIAQGYHVARPLSPDQLLDFVDLQASAPHHGAPHEPLAPATTTRSAPSATLSATA